METQVIEYIEKVKVIKDENKKLSAEVRLLDPASRKANEILEVILVNKKRIYQLTKELAENA